MEDFERLLKNKMEGASLNDIFPGFDKDEEWSGLKERLKPQKKRRFMLAWSHAAAILVGVMVGYFLIKEFALKGTVTQLTINVPPSKMIKPAVNTAAITDTLKKETAVKEKIKTEHVLTKKGLNKPIDINTITASVVKNKEPGRSIQKKADSGYDVPPQPVYRIAATVRHRQPAISMLDIMNEDRQFMINDQLDRTPGSKIFNQIQHQIINTEGFAASDDKPYVLRLLFAKQ